jgi:cytidyltransferase-like protein
MSSIGVIHGRFQPLHLGHMEYLLAGKSRCNFLWIGITNSDPEMTAVHPTNPKRSLPSSNPFTYYERLIMIRESLIEAGIPSHEFEIVPFPINYPERLKYYVPLDARFFVTIYDEWGRVKVDILHSLGLDIEIMWERSMKDRLTTGTEIRNLIEIGGDWQHLVPSSVRCIIEDRHLDNRIKNFKGK